MKGKTQKHAFLILSDCVSESLIRLYLQVQMATAHLGDTYIIYHNKTNTPEHRLRDCNVYEFTNAVMNQLGYTPIKDTLIPGSNHFPILKFHLDNPHYDYYWCIEDDIVFTGNWSSFFNQSIKVGKYDFISCFIKCYQQDINSHWYWWSSLKKVGEEIDPSDLRMSFNPIYSLSNKAAKFLDQSLKDGWIGHHEVLMATLLTLNKFIVRDFGGDGKYVPSGFKDKFYTASTHLWRPAFDVPGNLVNKIYHPVKNRFKITADFKFKISFCIQGKNILPQLKKTLAKNIENNYGYQDFEFVILDCDPRSGLELWVKETMYNHILNGKISYYKAELHDGYTHSRAKNIVFKLATGDILCNIDANYFTGRDFAAIINKQFKTRNNIVISNLKYVGSDKPIIDTNSEMLCIKKEDFLYVKGYDEEIKNPYSSNVDLINRLEIFKIKNVAPDNNIHINYSIENFSNDNVFITLDKILVRYHNPSVSTLIFVHHTGLFEMGTLVDNSTKGHADFKYAYLKRKAKPQYIIKENLLVPGNWYLANDDESLIFTTDTGIEFRMAVREDFYETELKNQQGIFYSVTDLYIKKQLVNCYHQCKSEPFKKSAYYKKGFYLNKNGFGKAIVYKNLNSNYPIVTN